MYNLPEYVVPQFVISMLTDELMEDCLGACDFPTLTVDTARNACYSWMSHSAMWVDEYRKFENELRKDPEYAGEDPMMVVESISGVIEDYLLESETIDYMVQKLNRSAVEKAIKATNISIPANEGAALLSRLVVGGADYVQDTLNAFENDEDNVLANVSLKDVISLAEAYAA